MIKAKQPKWQETIMALFGSDVEKKVKEAAAQGEPAWHNGAIGKTPGLWVFRIEAFNVKAWPKQGVFHKGDSYIVLWSRKRKPTEEALLHDVFFWIGSASSGVQYSALGAKPLQFVLSASSVASVAPEPSFSSDGLVAVSISPAGIVPSKSRAARRPSGS